MRRLVLIASLWLAAAPCEVHAAQEIVRWSFEESDKPTASVRGAVRATPRADSDEPRFSSEVPGPFISDPWKGRSRENRASGRFQRSAQESRPVVAQIDFARAGLTEESLTIEAFVKPAAEAAGDAWLAGQSRAGRGGSELALQWVELSNSNQTWHGVEFAAPDSDGRRWPVGHYSSSTRLDARVPAWRHLAIIYDARQRTVACWVDYHLVRSETLEGTLTWDDGPFLIGGRADHWGARGDIDEVRLCRGALQPAEFLRARRDAIEGVSFVSNQEIVPLDAGCLDAKEHFGAAGDGRTDDTDALNSAFAHLASRVPLAYNTLILPPGEYVVSGMLYCSRFVDVKGAGPGRTIIRLRDGAEGFGDPEQPRPVLRMSSTEGDPGSHEGVNGSSISIYLDGLTIDTGVGNPGAKGLEFHSNNVGRLENVVIRSGDGSGPLGLDLTHHDVGPALVKHVTIEGFDLGVALRYQEYSMTFEHLTLRGQRVAGLRNQGNLVALRGLVSENRVPALVCEGANSMLTVVDSQLQGRDGAEAAIVSEGAVYALRVDTQGYRTAIQKRELLAQDPPQWRESVVEGPQIEEYVGDHVVRGFGEGDGALRLPIEETPAPPARPLSDWVNLADFAGQKVGEDWGPAVQAAIDGGARVLYCPANLPVQFATPVVLRGSLERIVGFGADWNWSPDVWQDAGDRQQTDRERFPPALVTFDDPDAERTVWIERLGIQSLVHAAQGTLVLSSSSPGHYRTAAGGGRLFAEDVGGADWHFDHPQQVWVRQWNPESHAAGPCIHNQGATLWVLGFKTEYESQKLLAERGAQTEILGAFIYPLGEIPSDRPIFENRDSRMALVYGTSVYHANHDVHIRDVRGDEVRELRNDRLFWAGSRARMDLFISE